MGFLDNLKDRFTGQNNDDYYDDEYDDYYDEGGAAEPEHTGTGLLGNSKRPEAESVSVYTRSGRLVGGASGSGAGTGSASGGYRPAATPSYGANAPAATYHPSASGYRDEYSDTGVSAASPSNGFPARDTGYSRPAPAPAPAPMDSFSHGSTRVTSGQLPPYVIKPAAYDDVQIVLRRVRTNQPVVLVFRNTNIEAAKRILDFCFGLSCGIDGKVDELGDRVFAVLPHGIELTEADLDKLVADGDLVR